MSYVPIATTTLANNAQSVTFSSIPTSVEGVALRDLIMVINGRTVESGSYMGFAILNSSITGIYNNVTMAGYAASFSTSSYGGTDSFQGFAGGISSLPSTSIIHFLDYAATNKFKTFISRGDAPTELTASASTFRSTAAITSIRLLLSSNATFATGTSFSLYGIAG